MRVRLRQQNIQPYSTVDVEAPQVSCLLRHRIGSGPWVIVSRIKLYKGPGLATSDLQTNKECHKKTATAE